MKKKTHTEACPRLRLSPSSPTGAERFLSGRRWLGSDGGRWEWEAKDETRRRRQQRRRGRSAGDGGCLVRKLALGHLVRHAIYLDAGNRDAFGLSGLQALGQKDRSWGRGSAKSGPLLAPHEAAGLHPGAAARVRRRAVAAHPSGRQLQSLRCNQRQQVLRAR